MAKHQMFGYFNGKYYAVDEMSSILLSDTVDFKSEVLNCTVNEAREAEVDIYKYHSDLLVNCNSNRVAAMKDLMIHEEITEVDKTSGQLIISVKFELYNKDGQMIKSGTMEGLAHGHTPTILHEIVENNVMEYRKALLAHAYIDIPVPEISRYGIKNHYEQHPYTLKIKEVKLLTTVGGYKYFEADSQLQMDGCADECIEYNFFNHGHHFCKHNPLIHNNFASHFITNAPCGNTIIGSMITASSTSVPDEYETVEMADFPMDSTQCTVRINGKIKNIRIHIETLLDNFNEVYDTTDIQTMLAGIASGDISPIGPTESEDPSEPDEPELPEDPVDPVEPEDPSEPEITEEPEESEVPEESGEEPETSGRD